MERDSVTISLKKKRVQKEQINSITGEKATRYSKTKMHKAENIFAAVFTQYYHMFNINTISICHGYHEYCDTATLLL